MKTTKQIIIVDLEATCWENNEAYQKEHSEIIEIGICVLDRISGNITKNEGILVKPEQSEVSPFCEQLTSISQDMLDKNGVNLNEAIEVLNSDYHSKNYTWASYGAYDKRMMVEQCYQKGIRFPLGRQHLNVKEVFRMATGMRKSVGMKRALDIIGLPLKGTHHRGVDDAYNIARILHWSLNF